jgi:MoaA/NifB/PqqE/SkfB family radical SAM enzyme
MKPCRRVGLDVTWRCNWRCAHCFYRFGGNEHGQLGTPYDVPLETLLAKVDKARARGINHVVLEGWGEPTLLPYLGELLLAVRARGMTSSIITNGVQPVNHYAKMYYEWGLDHLHISSHGFGHTLATIADRKDAGEKQLRTKQWLQAEGLPFRTNVTLQAANYTEVPEIIRQDAELGSFHLNLLGFLPHYEWADPTKTQKVAVAPSKLRPYIEQAARYLKDNGKLFTIRYHPHCHLDPEFWPYVVNARYVLWDPFEWNYELQADDPVALWEAAKRLGDSVAERGESCNSCLARNHCGGYNRRNVASTGDSLAAITEVPAVYRDVWDRNGGLHDLNPANHLDGITPPFITDSRRGMPARAAVAEPATPDPRSLPVV